MNPEPAPARRLPVSGWLVAAALLPVFEWYVKRLDDGNDEPFGLVPLVLALWLAIRDRRELGATSAARNTGLALILASVATTLWLPPLIRAGIAVTGAALFYGIHRRTGLVLLLGLSLPLAASLQFYAGYPLRWISAEGSVRALHLLGHPALRTGTEVSVAGQTIGVDPACSGIRMLWHALVCAAALASIHRLGWRSTLGGVALALPLAIVVNVLRAGFLIRQEAAPHPGPDWLHEAIGLGGFALLLIPQWIHASSRARPPMPAPASAPVTIPHLRMLGLAAVAGPLLAIATPRPVIPTSGGPLLTHFTFDGIHRPLQPLPPTDMERAFAEGFPGTIASYLWMDRQVIVRDVTRATRRLHPTRDCLRASGYETTESVTEVRHDGATWSRFSAWKESQRLTIHERIVSTANGSSWTDVSAWFWSALLHPLNGPWRAETVIEREDPVRGGGFHPPSL